MQNAGLEEAQAGINMAGRNINNLRYADDTLMNMTFMAESKELKSLLVKEESQKAGLKLNIQKTKAFQKNIYFCFIDNAKALDCVDHNKL